MPTVDSEVAANLVTNNTKLHTSNYWSSLACLVKEQEESSLGSTTNVEMAMSAIAKGIPPNKVVVYWAQKLQNRKSRRFVFLDSGATSGAAPEEDAPDLDNTEQPSQKTFMFPDGRTGKATKKMLLKRNLCLAAREMNIVPGLHSALVSIPKLADAGYTTVFNKNGAAIYDDRTTTFTATNPPVLESEQCKHTGMWTLNLNPESTISNQEVPTAPPKTLNVIFDLPSSRETFHWCHAFLGFPPKETFVDAVHKGNYATWPKLTVTLINRYFPDSDKTIKGHLKGQCQGIRLTKQIALEKIIKNKQVRIKIQGENSHFHHIPITKTHEAFFRIKDLSDSIHIDQTRGDDQGIRENNKQDESSRAWDKKTHAGQ
jgi:hypothetical protein